MQRDQETQRLSKQVICLGIAAGVFAVGRGIVAMVTPQSPSEIGGAHGRLGSIVLGLALALLVPACGYFGAKREDSNLVGCFSCCNCLSCCCAITGLVGVFMGIAFDNALLDNCIPGNESSSCPDGFQWSKVCQNLPGHEHDSDWACYHYLQDLSDSAKRSLIWDLLFSVPTCILGCCSSVIGYKLYGKLTEPPLAVAPPVQVGIQQQAIQPHPEAH